jgi:hypothetical protein
MNKRENILKTAASLFANQGFDATTATQTFSDKIYLKKILA